MLDTQIHNPRSSEKLKRESETTTEVAAQKTIESHNEVQKVVNGERVSQKRQQQGNDAHNVSETKKIDTCTAASKKSEATEKHEI